MASCALVYNVMNIVIIFCLLAAAGAFGLWLLRRRAAARGLIVDRLYLLIHDGNSYVLNDARRENGCFIVNDVEYPCSVCRLVELATDTRIHIYMFAAEPIALTIHQQMMRHRAAVIKGHLFKSGGDMARLVNFVAAGAVLACAVFVYMSVGSLNAANVSQQVILEKIDKWTQSPLVIQQR